MQQGLPTRITLQTLKAECFSSVLRGLSPWRTPAGRKCPCSTRSHQKPGYDISKLLADIKHVPELNFEPVLREGAGPSCGSSQPSLAIYCSHAISTPTQAAHSLLHMNSSTGNGGSVSCRHHAAAPSVSRSSLCIEAPLLGCNHNHVLRRLSGLAVQAPCHMRLCVPAGVSLYLIAQKEECLPGRTGLRQAWPGRGTAPAPCSRMCLWLCCPSPWRPLLLLLAHLQSPPDRPCHLPVRPPARYCLPSHPCMRTGCTSKRCSEQHKTEHACGMVQYRQNIFVPGLGSHVV